MKAEIEVLTNTRASYVLYEAELHLLVALRRTMLSEVQSCGFEAGLIDISVNATVLQTVVLQHAIGMLPIRVSEARLAALCKATCRCPVGKSCDQCGLVFDLGLHNDTEDVQLVTSDDFVWQKTGHASPKLAPQERRLSSPPPYVHEPSEACLLPRITIVKLGPGQSIQVRAIAKVSSGAVNARFNPIAVVGIEPNWQVTVNPHSEMCLSSSQKQELAAGCPQKVFSITSDAASTLVVTNTRNCSGCRDCRLRAEKMGFRDLIRVRAPDKQHRFAVETVGTRSCVDVIAQACDLLAAKLIRLREALVYLRQDRRDHPEQTFWISSRA